MGPLPRSRAWRWLSPVAAPGNRDAPPPPRPVPGGRRQRGAGPGRVDPAAVGEWTGRVALAIPARRRPGPRLSGGVGPPGGAGGIGHARRPGPPPKAAPAGGVERCGAARRGLRCHLHLDPGGRAAGRLGARDRGVGVAQQLRLRLGRRARPAHARAAGRLSRGQRRPQPALGDPSSRTAPGGARPRLARSRAADASSGRGGRGERGRRLAQPGGGPHQTGGAGGLPGLPPAAIAREVARARSHGRPVPRPPPGPWAVAALAVLLPALSALAAWPLYLLARRWGLIPETALLAALLWLLAPARSLFTPSFDQALPALLVGAAWLASGGGRARAAAAGAL